MTEPQAPARDPPSSLACGGYLETGPNRVLGGDVLGRLVVWLQARIEVDPIG